MTILSKVKHRLAGAARAQGRRYSGDRPQPLVGYAATMGVYGALVAGLAAATRASGRPVPADARRRPTWYC
jgi:hypothetical protein